LVVDDVKGFEETKGDNQFVVVLDVLDNMIYYCTMKLLFIVLVNY
jgi:hypothetical protein